MSSGAFGIFSLLGRLDDSERAQLIFVTNITNYICGEKIVMWRNFVKFWEILPQFTRFHVEKN